MKEVRVRIIARRLAELNDGNSRRFSRFQRAQVGLSTQGACTIHCSQPKQESGIAAGKPGRKKEELVPNAQIGI